MSCTGYDRRLPTNGADTLFDLLLHAHDQCLQTGPGLCRNGKPVIDFKTRHEIRLVDDQKRTVVALGGNGRIERRPVPCICDQQLQVRGLGTGE